MSKKLLDDISLGISHVLGGWVMVVVFAPDFKSRVKVTRKHEKSDKDLVVTIGPLNYRERAYVKLCKKHGTKPRKLWFPLGK